MNDTKGHEYYGNIAEKITQYGEEGFIEFFMNLQIFGTPDECYNRIIEFGERTGAERFVGVFSYSEMPWEESDRNMRLFSKKVCPRLHTAEQRKGQRARGRLTNINWYVLINSPTQKRMAHLLPHGIPDAWSELT